MAFSLSIILLFSALQLQLVITQSEQNNKCIYATSYDEKVDGGKKVLHALMAQQSFITDYMDEIHNMFQPSLPNVSRNISSAAIESVIELIKMKERYNYEDSLVQILLRKVAEESCNWVKVSLNISHLNCTNITKQQLEELSAWQFRIDLFNTINDTLYMTLNSLPRERRNELHYCAWINNRIPGSCTDSYRSTLNNNLCNSTLIPRDCAQFCTDHQ